MKVDLWPLVTRLVAEVGASLADASLDAPGLGDVARKALAARLLEERLDTVVKERFESGEPGLAVEDEDAVRDAVLAHLFGRGEIERLLASDAAIENIN